MCVGKGESIAPCKMGRICLYNHSAFYVMLLVKNQLYLLLNKTTAGSIVYFCV